MTKRVTTLITESLEMEKYYGRHRHFKDSATEYITTRLSLEVSANEVAAMLEGNNDAKMMAT